MAGGASEQVAVVEKSSLSLEEMPSMTRQNAPDSKESALTTEGMNAQAEHLCGFIGGLIARVSGSANRREKDIKRPAFKAELEPILKTI